MKDETVQEEEMDVWRSTAVFQLPRQLKNRPLFWSSFSCAKNML